MTTPPPTATTTSPGSGPTGPRRGTGLNGRQRLGLLALADGPDAVLDAGIEPSSHRRRRALGHDRGPGRQPTASTSVSRWRAPCPTSTSYDRSRAATVDLDHDGRVVDHRRRREHRGDDLVDRPVRRRRRRRRPPPRTVPARVGVSRASVPSGSSSSSGRCSPGSTRDASEPASARSHTTSAGRGARRRRHGSRARAPRLRRRRSPPAAAASASSSSARSRAPERRLAAACRTARRTVDPVRASIMASESTNRRPRRPASARPTVVLPVAIMPTSTMRPAAIGAPRRSARLRARKASLLRTHLGARESPPNLRSASEARTQRHHRLGHDAHRRHRGDVGALLERRRVASL